MAAPIQFHLIPAIGFDEQVAEKGLKIIKSYYDIIFRRERDLTPDHYLLCAAEANSIVGIAKISMPKDAPNLHTEFIEVIEMRRGRGIGSRIENELFDLAAANQKQLTSGGLTAMGQSYLQRAIERGRQKYGPDSYKEIGR